MTELSLIPKPQVWEGADVLRAFLVPIEELVPMEDNPRDHDVPMIQESFRRFGQVIPIIVREDGRSLVSGHGRLEAVAGLGWTHLAALPTSYDSDEAARLFAMLDNVTSDAGRTKYELFQMDLFSTVEGAPLPEFEEFTRARADAIKTSEFVPFEGGFSEDPESAAARAAALAQSARMREVVMMLNEADYELFGSRVRLLMPIYEATGAAQTMLRALQEEAYRHAAPAEPAA